MLKQLMTQFQTALQGSGLHPLPREQAVECLPSLIAQFENKPENRAGMRVRRVPRQRVCRTLKHLKRAAAAGAQDSAIGREAHKLLRAIRTFPDFETLEKRAKAFIGSQNRISRRRNEREMRKRAPVIQLDKALALHRVDTAGHLTTIGRMLKLCVTQRHRGYQHALRDGSLVFWSIQRDGEAIGLLSIDPDAKEVEECNGLDHKPLGLDRVVMLQILRKLNVTADHCAAFTSVGALAMFLQRPARQPDVVFEFQGDVYRLWGSGGKIAIHQGQSEWSYFRWCSTNREWEESYCNEGISLGQLVNLVAYCPEIAKLAREQRACAATSSGKAMRRRPRRRRHAF